MTKISELAEQLTVCASLLFRSRAGHKDNPQSSSLIVSSVSSDGVLVNVGQLQASCRLLASGDGRVGLFPSQSKPSADDPSSAVVADVNNGKGVLYDVNNGKGVLYDVNNGKGVLYDVNNGKGVLYDVNNGKGVLYDVNNGKGVLYNVNNGKGVSYNVNNGITCITRYPLFDIGQRTSASQFHQHYLHYAGKVSAIMQSLRTIPSVLRD